MQKVNNDIRTRQRASMPSGKSAYFSFENDGSGTVNFLYDDDTRTKGSLMLDDVEVTADKPQWMKDKEQNDWDHNILNPRANFLNSVIMPSFLHGLPRTGGYLLGNTVGKVIDAVPEASTILSWVTPSRWAGSIGDAFNGKFTLPSDEDNKGWSSMLGDEYGEAADFYGDMLFGGKALKLGKSSLSRGINKGTQALMKPHPSLYARAQSYGYNNPILEDVLLRPQKTLDAYKNGQYFFTKNGWRNYYRQLHNQAEGGRSYNQQILDGLIQKLREEHAGSIFFNEEKYANINEHFNNALLTLKKGDNYKKLHGGGSDGIQYTSPSGKFAISLKATKDGNTLLPYENVEGLVGTSAHEFNHVVQDLMYQFPSQHGFYGETVYSPSLGYYTVNGNHPMFSEVFSELSKIGKRSFSKKEIENMSKNSEFENIVKQYNTIFDSHPRANTVTVPRGVWQSSPNEVFSELTKFRMNHNYQPLLNEWQLRQFSEGYAHRFNLLPEELYKIGKYAMKKGYKHGGKIK